MLQTLDFTSADVFMREKLTGTPLFKIVSQSRTYLVGGPVAFMVSDDFPVEMGEWFEGDVHVLHPYGLAPLQIGKLDFVPHMWEAVCAPRLREYSEGAMVLFSGIEYRVKRTPTIEVNAEEDVKCVGRRGIWEVCLLDEDFHYLLPRPGKAHFSCEKARHFLKSCALVNDLVFPEMSPITVQYVNEGPFNGNFGQRGPEAWFDSGWRLAESGVSTAKKGHDEALLPDSIYRVGDVYHHCRGVTEMISPHFCATMKPTVTGSKACIFDHTGSIYLFKDKDKSYDFVGGGIKPEEDSRQALIREIWEELGVNVHDVKCLGLSSMIEDGVDYHTYVYLVPLTGVLVKVKNLLYELKSYDYGTLMCVPWIRRLLNAVSQKIPDTKKLLEYYMKMPSPKKSDREALYNAVPRSALLNYRHSAPVKFKDSGTYEPPHVRRRRD